MHIIGCQWLFLTKNMFQFEGKLYKFVCLPNGLTSAPRLFTKILKPVFGALHKEGHDIMGYLGLKPIFAALHKEGHDIMGYLVLKPVFAALHNKGHGIMGYLDDSILFGDTFEECK